MSRKKQNKDLVDDYSEGRLSSPLDLKIRLKSPRSDMDLVPFLDFLFIGILFFLLSSKLIYSPGIAMELPALEDSLLDNVRVDEVLSINLRDNEYLFFYRGAIYNWDRLRSYAENEDFDKERNALATLLVKMDSAVSLEMQTNIIGLCKQLGYSRIQLAIEPYSEPPLPFNREIQ